MALSVDEMNDILRAVMAQMSLEESNIPVTTETQDFYDATLADVANAPEGVMISPINEWQGGEDSPVFDDVYEFLRLHYANKSTIDETSGNYEITKATNDGEKRFTLGAMYIPDLIDAHNEWTDGDELQKAVWDYVKTDDRRIRLQHNREIVAGEWVEIMAFPYEITVPMVMPNGTTTQKTYPANTVFMGVQWTEWAWELVKSGKILGYSIGGKAQRLYVDMEKDASVNDVHVDTIMDNDKKSKKKVRPTVAELESVSPDHTVLTKAELVEAFSEAMKSFSPNITIAMPEPKSVVKRIERDETGAIIRVIEE